MFRRIMMMVLLWLELWGEDFETLMVRCQHWVPEGQLRCTA
jgi:hypothetical protein